MDENRIDEFLENLGEYWKNYCPHYSFMNFIKGFKSYVELIRYFDFYELTDEDFISLVEDYFNFIIKG